MSTAAPAVAPGLALPRPGEPNAYWACLSHAPAPIRWTLDQDEHPGVPGYLRETFRALDARLGPRGLAFFVTWNLETLPAYGDRVVAVPMADEWCQAPAYADRVLATFKPYGTRVPLGVRSVRAGRLGALVAAKQAVVLAHNLPGYVRAARRGGEVHPIPLGYGNQLDLPPTPIRERPTDVFFAGSVAHWRPPKSSVKYWVENPKTLSRRTMLDAVDALRARRPDLRAETLTTEGFVLNALAYGTAPPEVLRARAYSEALMNAKVCLAPRGTSPETFRYFEGLRYGCVVVTERMPKRWFYDGAPVVELDTWRDLGPTVERLLADPARLDDLHARALAWWRDVCSEAALAAYMAERIEARLKAADPG